MELRKLATNPSGEGWVSTFEALAAHLPQQIYRSRLQMVMSEDGTSAHEAAAKVSRHILTAFNLRGPEQLNMPPRYFPNAAYPLIGVPSHEQLTGSPLWELAKLSDILIREADIEAIEQTGRWIVLQPDRDRAVFNFTTGIGSVAVSQWSRYGMYMGVDFDVDETGEPITPVLVSPPINSVWRTDGLAIVIGTEEELYPAAVKQYSSGTAQPAPETIRVGCDTDAP